MSKYTKNKLKTLSIIGIIIIFFIAVNNYHKPLIISESLTSLNDIDINTYNNLMIVAHPDDEVIWGGHHLIKDNYIVICLTNSSNTTRKKEFNKVMKETHSKGIILDYPDKTHHKRDTWKTCYQDIYEQLDYILSHYTFKNVVTHNPKGEYGHIHHVMTSEIVTDIMKTNHQTDHLQYFGQYYKKKNSQHLVDPLNQSELMYKEKICTYYQSQSRVMKHLKHMFPYENWINYQDWQF